MENRWRRLIETGIAVTSELSLEALLQCIVESAAQITGAKYAALGVIDRSGRALERFLTTGIDEEAHERIGDLPHGRGILGVLINDAHPLRLHDLTTDPRAVGFPPYHPPMRSFLGVPILLRGVAYGNLYLSEKESGDDFTSEDQELVTMLASQAAVAIENARLYESATRWLTQLESLTEIGNALAGETDLDSLLDLISTRLAELIDAELVVIAIPVGGGSDLRIAAAAGPAAEEMVGTMLSRQGSKSARVLERRRSERVDSTLEDVEIDQELARRMGLRSGLFVPMVVADRPIGVLAAHNKLGTDPRFSEEDLRLTETFAARAAVAVDLADRVARDALRRVVEGQELERRRLARELHDETGQALTSILLGLKQVEEAKTPEDARTGAAALREQIVHTLQNVRRLAVELRPSALDDFGLAPALERLAEAFGEQSGISVDIQTNLEQRLPPEAETALYRIVQEALTNVAKHAEATRVSIVVTRRGNAVTAVIEDDGQGFGAGGGSGDGLGLGLVGMKERVGLLGGRLAIESTEGAGTTVVAEVPVA